METAVASILARPVSHPLAIVPLILDVVEKKRLDELLGECRRLGLRSDIAIGRAINCIEAAECRSDMTSRCKGAMEQIASWLFDGAQPLQGPLSEWLTTDNVVASIGIASPKLAAMMHSALVVAEGGGSSGPLSLTTVCVVMNRTIPLSLHAHPLGRLMTFSRSSQRLAIADNVDQLWRREPMISVVDLPQMVSGYVSHLRLGFDLKALRWVELHAVLLCTRALCGCPSVGADTVSCVMDLVHLLLTRCIAKGGSLGPSSDLDDADARPPSRPTTAGSGGGVGRLGAVSADDERLELTSIVIRLMGCVTKLCFGSALQCAGSELVLQHPLWQAVVSVEWGVDSSTRAMTELWCSASLALLDSGVRLLLLCPRATRLLVSCDLALDNDDDAVKMTTCAVTMLRYAMACAPIPPPPHLAAPLTSLIGAVCLASAQRVAVAASSTYHDAGATSRLLRQQRALRRLAVHDIVCSNIVDWQMALAMTAASVLDTARDDGASMASVAPWVEASMWLYWHFSAACAPALATSNEVLEPVLTLDDCEAESAAAIADALVSLMSELRGVDQSGSSFAAIECALSALYFLYQVIDLDSVDAIAPHMRCWMGIKDTCVASGAPAVRAAVHRCVGCFVVQQRINIAVHADFGPFVDMLVELMRNGTWTQQEFAIDVSRQLLMHMNASTLLTDNHCKSLLIALFGLASTLWDQSRTDNQAGLLMHTTLQTIASIVSSSLDSNGFEHLMLTFPEITLQYQHLMSTTRGNPAAHAALLVAAPLSVTTPSDVARVISQLQRATCSGSKECSLVHAPCRHSVQQVAHLFCRWTTCTSPMWQRALLDFTTQEFGAIDFTEFLCASLQSPWQKEVADLMGAVIKVTQVHRCSGASLLNAATSSTSPALLLAAILWTMHAADDAMLPHLKDSIRSAMSASSKQRDILNCCNGPRILLIDGAIDACSGRTVVDGDLPHFRCLLSEMDSPSPLADHVRKAMVTSPDASIARCGRMLGSVLSAVLFGPYRIDAGVPLDVACTANAINELQRLLHDFPDLRPGVAHELFAVRCVVAPSSLCGVARSASHRGVIDDILLAVHGMLGAAMTMDMMTSLLVGGQDGFIEQTRTLLSAYYG